jgi:hypothetical protein
MWESTTPEGLNRGHSKALRLLHSRAKIAPPRQRPLLIRNLYPKDLPAFIPASVFEEDGAAQEEPDVLRSHQAAAITETVIAHPGPAGSACTSSSLKNDFQNCATHDWFAANGRLARKIRE